MSTGERIGHAIHLLIVLGLAIAIALAWWRAEWTHATFLLLFLWWITSDRGPRR